MVKVVYCNEIFSCYLFLDSSWFWVYIWINCVRWTCSLSRDPIIAKATKKKSLCHLLDLLFWWLKWQETKVILKLLLPLTRLSGIIWDDMWSDSRRDNSFCREKGRMTKEVLVIMKYFITATVLHWLELMQKRKKEERERVTEIRK